VLLQHVQGGRQQHDEDNDRKACKIARGAGDPGGNEQDRYERVGEAAEKIRHEMAALTLGNLVRSVAFEALGRLGCRQSSGRCAETIARVGKRSMPECGLFTHKVDLAGMV